MSDEYSNNKAIYHLPVLQSLQRGGKLAAPVHVQLILSDLCNHHCSFCSYRMEDYTSNQLFHVLKPDGSKNSNPNRMIPTEKALEIINDCRDMGVKAIQLTGGGEPTLHPDIDQVCSTIREHGIKFSIVTNGSEIGAGGLAMFLDGASWIRISIDAGTKQTYMAMRGVSEKRWKQAWSAIDEMRTVRECFGGDMIIGVGFVVTKENWKEVVQATQLARDAGADNIRISAIFSNGGVNYFKDFWTEARALCHETEKLATENFKVFNMFADRLHDLSDGPPGYEKCHYQHFTTYIGGDLNVYRCCNTAYNQRGLIGSLKEQSFRELWESQATQDAYRSFDARGCERCQFNGKNMAIQSILDEMPEHVEFV